jgi:single-stranded-DNA-specific exonuclease
LVARVLAARGVSAENAPTFLDPTLKSLMPDPSTLTDMDRLAERLADAVAAEERIAIFGDYDVDGASAAALLTRFLRTQGGDPQIYIPDRLFEGYGLNPDAMRSLAAAGNRLVIAVDCGTSSFEALQTAQDLGLDVVVIDHHQAGIDLPPTKALVNPNREDDLSGLGYLCAAGLTFLAIVAVNRLLRQRDWYSDDRPEPDLLEWLDLAALGTVCDVVPLIRLNRAFVSKGLKTLARRKNRGLAALADNARVGGGVGPYQLGFMIGPRINAGGRIGDAGLGAQLLTSNDPGECERLALELERLNQERQAIETAMLEEAVAEAEAEIGAGEGPPVLLSGNERWHAGVVGLIAARLKERFNRPAVAVAFQPNGLGTGSGRSIAGVDLGHAVRGALDRGIIVKGGGHAMAAGLTVERSRLGDLRAYLVETLSSAVEAARGNNHGLAVDAAMTARSASLDVIGLVERAGPFGTGHPEPVFAFPAHRVDYVEAAGNGHIRLSLATGEGSRLKAIAFRAADGPLGKALIAARGRSLHIAGVLSIDQWQGQSRPSLRVIDAAEPSG